MEKKNLLICEFCRKKIRRKEYLFVNTTLMTSKIHFCSKLCKEKWISNLHKNKLSKIIIWKIGTIFERNFFIRKVFSKIGPDSRITYFSNDIINIKRIESI